MDQPADTKAPLSPYHGQRLGAGEVRLLAIEVRHQEVYLTTQVHKLDDIPEYVAVSYVWGPTPASTVVNCNGEDLLVTPTAHRMLQFLPSGKLYWIDAICINQDDAAEKEVQIPLMQRLYSEAVIVTVWTGLATPESHKFMTELPQALETARRWTSAVAEGIDPSTQADCNLPPKEDPFWVGLYQVLHNEWLRRLWTFQEVVFAKNSIVLSETAWIWPNDLIEFAVEGRLRGYFHYDQASVGFVCDNPKAADDAIVELEMIPKMRLSLQGAQRWHHPYLLHDLRSRQVKEPVDRIWAVAALLIGPDGHEFAHLVDYSVTGRVEYWTTYRKAFQTMIEESRELQVLNIPPSVDSQRDKLPSWCRDISQRFACGLSFMQNWNSPLNHTCQFFHNFLTSKPDDQTESATRWAEVVDHKRKSISFGDNGSQLLIRGFVVETIVEIVEESQLQGREDYAEEPYIARVYNHPLHSVNMDWHRRSLALARRLTYGDVETSDIPEEYLMAFFADHRIKNDIHIEYKDTMEKLINRAYFNHGSERLKTGRSFIERFRGLAGHTFFATESGRFGIAQPGCKPGDKVCVFYGGHPLYILRWPSDGRDKGAPHSDAPATFCGIAYIPHLMEPQQSDAARLGNDEIFVIA